MDGQYKLLKQNEYCRIPLNVNSPIGHAQVNTTSANVIVSEFTTKSNK
jgi:hypothetical protein